MAVKEIIVKKNVVRLSDVERERLAKLIRKGSGPAQRLLKTHAFRGTNPSIRTRLSDRPTPPVSHNSDAHLAESELK